MRPPIFRRPRPDHFRDIAQAQTVRDGHFLSDPYYRGEWA
jgi:hypothetical protein